MLVEFLGGRGSAEAGHTYEAITRPQPLVPALRDGGLDGDARAVAQHAVLISTRLLAEQFERGHRDDGGADAVFCQQSRCFDGDGHFRAGGEQRHVALLIAAHHVRAFGGEVFFDSAGAQFGRHGIACQRHYRRAVVGGKCDVPGFRRLDSVGRTQHLQTRDRAQRRQMFDGLMRGAVFADADGIVRHDVDRANAHQSREADRGTAVIGKDEERRAERDQSAVQCDAVHCGRHAVFADPEVDIIAVVFAGRDGLVVRGLGAVGRRQVGRAANQFWDSRDQMLERHLRPDA